MFRVSTEEGERSSDSELLTVMTDERETGGGRDPVQEISQEDQTTSFATNNVSEDIFTRLEACEDPPPTYDEVLRHYNMPD